MKALYDEMIKKSAEVFPHRRFVGGEGSLNASLVLIGEAPGGEEEKQGRPFVGKAGKNLSEFLELLCLKREDIYITNVVKLRPFKVNEKTGRLSNRPPNRAEVDFFKPYLYRELDIIKPQIVVTLGNFALRAATNDSKPVIGDVHGIILNKNDRCIFPLYHPASIIYNRALKEVYINDVLKLKDIIKK